HKSDPTPPRLLPILGVRSGWHRRESARMVENRRQNMGIALVSGLLAGVACYVVAELLVPRDVTSPGDHDIFLANRLGFIYASTTGLWLAWLQRSPRRAALAIVVGIGVGLAYMWLCASRNFLAIMVGFPCLLGGALAAILGSNRSPWLRDAGWRIV